MRKIIFLFFFISSNVFGQEKQQHSLALDLLSKSEGFLKEKAYDSSYLAGKASLKHFIETSNDSLIIASSLLLIQNTEKVHIDERNEYFLLAKDNALLNQDWNGLLTINYTMGKVFYNLRDFGLAMPYLLEVDSIASANQLKNKAVVKSILYRSEISRTTFTHDGVELAHDLQNEALELAKEINSEELVHNIYLRLADMHGLKHNFPEVKKYLDLAFNYYKDLDNAERMSRVYLTYMNYYYGINDFDAAGEKLEEGITYLTSKNNPEKLAEMVVWYGTYFQKRRNNCPKAIEQFEIAKKIYTDLGATLNSRYMHLVEGLAICHGELGDFEKGYSYYQETYITKRELVKKANNNLSRDLETKYQAEKKKQEIALLNSQNRLIEQRRKNQRNVLLAGLSLALFAGIFIFFQYRNRQKTNIKLKELDKAKSTFFANISHEFRTPLTLIKGPIEDQLSSLKLKQGERKNLLSAQRNTQRLEKLVEQLLALSKLESDHFKLQIEPSNLPNFIAVQAEAFSFACHEKRINYSVKIASDTSIDWYDRDVLEKVLFNLIGNALKFTPESGEIEVSGNRNHEKYVIEIKNSGNYIHPKEINKIFDRFYRADVTITGTGIGLALSKELVELHNGSILATSSPEGFTIFRVEIPISQTAFNDSDIISQEFHDLEKTIAPLLEELDSTSALTLEDAPILLIIDDSSDIRNYISSIFETTYVIHQASDGADGLLKALEIIPDLIICDVMMPKENGVTLTKNVKQHELIAHVPVILLTAKIETSDKLEGMDAGADGYITKPFSSQLLKTTVKNLIENRRKLQQRFSQEIILTPKDIAISTADEQFLNRLQKVLDEKITDSNFSIEEFCSEMIVSRMQLHRKLKALTGQSTSEFLRSQRLKLAVKLLKSKELTISDVCYAVGFSDPSYFTRCFKQEFGCSPSEYPKNK